MSKKGGGWLSFWFIFFLIAIFPKLIAKENARLEWTIRLTILAICLSPFWLGFLLCLFEGKL
ncbi:MAG: hypothetical protein J5672_02115 [Verrucomicrobia bacterium]|nr:hypothetical protein [Verrucomicrobiota bacterium]